MPELFTNQGTTTVSSGGTGAPAQGTGETWTVASSASFPAIGAGQQFHVADPASATTAAEIIAVTAVSGTTWTVTRGAESTTPVAHAAGFTVQNLISAASLSTFAQAGNGDLGGTGAAPTVTSLAHLATTTFTFGSTGGVPAAGTFTAGNAAIDQNSILRACTVSGSPGTWARAGQRPHEFYADDYGCKGDGKVIQDANMTNGSAVLTSASANFTAGDVGKAIMVNGALGSPAEPLYATISSRQSATQVTLSASATAGTSSAGVAIYGSDDTTAVNNCVTAASGFAQGTSGSGAGFGNFYAHVVFGPKFYCLASGPTQVGDGSTVPTFNSQIPLPYPAANGTTQKLVVKFSGPGDAAQCSYFNSTTADLQGATLVSMITCPGSGGSATFGAQSVMGGPTSGSGFGGGFANVKPVIEGLMVICPTLANQIAFDFRYAGGFWADKSSVHPSDAVAGSNFPRMSGLPSTSNLQNGHSVGLFAPVTGNNDDCAVGTFTVEGMSEGYNAGEHFTATRLNAIYCDTGLFCNVSGGALTIHGISVLYYSCEGTNHALRAPTTGAIQMPVFIGLMDTEVINTWDINDSANYLTGTVNWADFERTTMNVNGAANLNILNTRLTRVVQGAPAYTLGTAFQNPWWRNMWVQLTGGTTTGILIGPTSATATTSIGTTTPVTFKLPSGWWLNIQGSVKPTTFNAVPD